jgi:hypothetical protein
LNVDGQSLNQSFAIEGDPAPPRILGAEGEEEEEEEEDQ